MISTSVTVFRSPMFVKGYIVDLDKIAEERDRSTDEKDPHDSGHVYALMAYIGRLEAYKYTAFVEDDSGHLRMVIVLLEGEDRKELQDMPMPLGDPKLLEAAKCMLTPGVWEKVL